MSDTSGESGGTGRRLQRLAEALYDGNKSALARAVGMKPGSFSKYLRGKRRPGAPVLERLAGLGVNLNWLVTGEGPIRVESDTASEGENVRVRTTDGGTTILVGETTLYRVPQVRLRIDETGTLQLDETGEEEWVSQDQMQCLYREDEPSGLIGVHLPCNRMAPTIQMGDRVRAALLSSDTADAQLREGAPYLIKGLTGILTMRVYREDGRVRLAGDNPDVPDEWVEAAAWGDTYRPVARVLEVTRLL